MYSVTKRIKMIKQPRGGYIKRTDFEMIEGNDCIELNAEENIHANLVGLTVDYMTRFMMGASIENAFQISLIGARNIKDEKKAKNILSKVKGLDDESIICACKLSGYDVCYRAGIEFYKPVSEIKPNKETIQNISSMVKRGMAFWKKYGPIVKDGFTFEGGYTKIVSNGDGDYLTQDTLWDFKVSKKEINSQQTLQLLMYYIMGIHSENKEFQNIKKLGIFNPRKNKVYLLKIGEIGQDIIDKVSHDVIGYGLTDHEIKDELIRCGISETMANLYIKVKA